MAVTDLSSVDAGLIKSWFRDRWIVSRRYDLFFFIGSCVLTVAFWGLYQLSQQMHLWKGDAVLFTYFVFTALFDQPHIMQTFSRTHLDAIEFNKRRWLHTWGLTGLILIGFVVIGMRREAELIVFASMLGSYHIIRQHFGLLKAYKNLNRDRHPIDDWLDFGVFYSGMFAGLLNDYTETGNPVVIYGDLISAFPDLPPVFSELTWRLFILFLALFVIRQCQNLWNRKQLNLPKLLLLAATLSTHYFIFFMTATPFLVAEALETAYHDVQYQGWIMHYQSQRFPAVKLIVVKWLGMALVYGVVAGTIEILGLLEYRWAMWLFAPFTMMIIYHYLVDGLIWKLSQQPELHCLFAASQADDRNRYPA